MIEVSRAMLEQQRNQNNLFVFRIYTEIWDEKFMNGEHSKHYLENNDYYSPFQFSEAALFLVDQDFCNQNIVHHADPE